MKKTTVWILLFAMLFALCGCSRLENLKNVELPPLPEATQAQSAEAPSEPVEPVEPTTVIDTSASEAESKLSNHVIVSVTEHSEQHYDPQHGEKLILTFSYETPAVYIEGRDQAMNAVNEYIATLDETYYTGNEYGVGQANGRNGMLEMATDNYTYAVENNLTDMTLEFVSARSVKLKRVDSKLLSMVYNTYAYTGGVHGLSVDYAYNFAADTGELLTLEMLSADYDGLFSFLSETMCALYQEDADGYYSAHVVEDYFETDYKTAFENLLREGSWYFDEQGMVIFSSVYELAPYAAGMTEFKIPYDQLKDHIDAKYLPETRSGETGSLTLKRQSDVEDGTLEIIDKVTVDQGGEALCVLANGTVYDVRLNQVDYADMFYETAQLWACSYMDDCILQLEALVPEGMPNLMLSYREASGALHRLLLTQSAEDGSYILTDEAIEAVG